VNGYEALTLNKRGYRMAVLRNDKKPKAKSDISDILVALIGFSPVALCDGAFNF
jgi:hypothetical protein